MPILRAVDAAKHDQFVRPDIPAGIGYLAVGLAAGIVEVALIINRRRFARALMEHWVSGAARTSPRPRRSLDPFARPEWQDEGFRERTLIWVWLPPILFAPVIAIIFLFSAVTEFGR